MLFHSSQGAGDYMKIKDITFVNSYSYIDHTGSITMPSGIQNKDLLIVAQNGYTAGINTFPTITISAGTGFTLVNTLTGTYTLVSGSTTIRYRAAGAISYKIADGTESDTVISNFINNTYNETAVLFHLRANRPVRSVVHRSPIAFSTEGNPAATNLNTSINFEIPYYMNSLITGTVAISTTPETLSTVQTTRITAGIWKSLNKPSTYTFDSDDGGSLNVVLGGILAIN